MESLPKDVIVFMALKYDLRTILNLCQTNKHFNKLICLNNVFWMNKTVKDYGYYGHIPRVLNKLFKNMFNQKIIWRDYYKILYINKGNHNMQRGFNKAIKDEDNETVKVLLNDIRIDPSVRHNYAIRFVSENQNIEMVKLLLTHPKVDPSDKNNYAIIFASQFGHLEVVKLLLIHPKVDPTAQDYLSVKNAAKNGHRKVYELLLDDPRVGNNKGTNNIADKYPLAFTDKYYRKLNKRLYGPTSYVPNTVPNPMYSNDEAMRLINLAINNNNLEVIRLSEYINK